MDVVSFVLQDVVSLMPQECRVSFVEHGCGELCVAGCGELNATGMRSKLCVT